MGKAGWAAFPFLLVSRKVTWGCDFHHTSDSEPQVQLATQFYATFGSLRWQKIFFFLKWPHFASFPFSFLFGHNSFLHTSCSIVERLLPWKQSWPATGSTHLRWCREKRSGYEIPVPWKCSPTSELTTGTSYLQRHARFASCRLGVPDAHDS